MTCASCGSDNRPGRRFCGKCGAPLARVSAGCGASSDADESFCGDCGAGLAEGAPRPQATALGPTVASSPVAQPRTAERRHVTVLFADLVGFTPLSQQRDAEDVREPLGRYFDTFVRLGAKPWMVRVTPEPLRSSTETQAAAATPA